MVYFCMIYHIVCYSIVWYTVVWYSIVWRDARAVTLMHESLLDISQAMAEIRRGLTGRRQRRDQAPEVAVLGAKNPYTYIHTCMRACLHALMHIYILLIFVFIYIYVYI